MQQETITKEWEMERPDANGDLWTFAFSVVFTWTAPQRVVIQWGAPSIGSGGFVLAADGIDWGVLFETYQMLGAIVSSRVLQWNSDSIPR